jgi:hypothetical protein
LEGLLKMSSNLRTVLKSGTRLEKETMTSEHCSIVKLSTLIVTDTELLCCGSSGFVSDISNLKAYPCSTSVPANRKKHFCSMISFLSDIYWLESFSSLVLFMTGIFSLGCY